MARLSDEGIKSMSIHELYEYCKSNPLEGNRIKSIVAYYINELSKRINYGVCEQYQININIENLNLEGLLQCVTKNEKYVFLAYNVLEKLSNYASYMNDSTKGYKNISTVPFIIVPDVK